MIMQFLNEKFEKQGVQCLVEKAKKTVEGWRICQPKTDQFGENEFLSFWKGGAPYMNAVFLERSYL